MSLVTFQFYRILSLFYLHLISAAVSERNISDDLSHDIDPRESWITFKKGRGEYGITIHTCDMYRISLSTVNNSK